MQVVCTIVRLDVYHCCHMFASSFPISNYSYSGTVVSSAVDLTREHVMLHSGDL